MKKMKFGILIVVAFLALVSVASAAFPFAVSAKGTWPGSGSYWDVNVITSASPADLAVSPPNHDGWCISPAGMYQNTVYNFMAYSTLGPIPATVPYSYVSQWDKVNYILNNEHADWRITQAAIWHYDGQSAATHPYHDVVCPDSGVGACSGGYLTGPATTPGTYENYIAQVDTYGAGFIPKCNEFYAIILYKPDVQAVIVKGQKPDCGVPEFPTLALPVAMLIGVVGAVQYLKTRKE